MERLVRTVLAAVVVVLLLATGGGFLGNRWWGLDLVANLRPQYVVMFALVAGVGALVGQRAVVVLALFGIVVNTAVIVPLYLDRPAQDAADDALRVMMLNVKIRQAEPSAVADHLRAADHDLVFLLAATRAWSEVLRRSDIPYQILVSQPPGVDLEIVVLSRRPDLPTRIHQWGEYSRSSAVEVTVELTDGPVRVLATHPVSPLGPQRTRMRDRQFEQLARWARSEPTPFLIVGDLNATPWSSSFRALLEDGQMVNSQVGSGLSPSWPVTLGPLGVPIDHALHAPGLVTVERTLGPSFGSEHRSLRIEVARADASASAR